MADFSLQPNYWFKTLLLSNVKVVDNTHFHSHLVMTVAYEDNQSNFAASVSKTWTFSINLLIDASLRDALLTVRSRNIASKQWCNPGSRGVIPLLLDTITVRPYKLLFECFLQYIPLSRCIKWNS